MDSCFGILTFLLSVTLVTSHYDPQPPKPKVTEEQIIVICSRTQNPPYCLRTLNSDPRLDKSNIEALANTTLHLASAYAKKIYNEIDSIINISAGTRRVREKYQLCAENYKESIAELIEASKYLTIGDYRNLRVQILSAIENAKKCEENVHKTSKTITPIHENNRDFRHLCSIIWSISNRLP